MDTTEVVKENYYTIKQTARRKAGTNDTALFLSYWIENNTETINEQFEIALSETLKKSSDQKEIVKVFVYNMVLQSLDYISNAERECIQKRQADGIRMAKERGVRFGRRKLEKPSEFYTLYFKYKKGELSARKCGEKLNVSHSTFLKWVKETDNI